MARYIIALEIWPKKKSKLENKMKRRKVTIVTISCYVELVFRKIMLTSRSRTMDRLDW